MQETAHSRAGVHRFFDLYPLLLQALNHALFRKPHILAPPIRQAFGSRLHSVQVLTAAALSSLGLDFHN